MANEEFVQNEGAEPRKLTLDVDVKETGACGRHITITVSREDVDFYKSREVEELWKNQSFPGFRPGKAPRKLVEKRFHKEIADRVKGALILDSISQANADVNLVPISEPDLKVDALVVPEEGPFVYEYDIEVRPTFDIPNWKGLKLKKYTHEFTPEEIDAAILRFRTNFGTLEKKDGPAELGDYIETNLTFEADGKAFSPTKKETIRIRKTLSFTDCEIKDFDKFIEGAVPGDVRVHKVVLSQDILSEELRGKEFDAKFEILNVMTANIPELDDELLQRAGGFENIGDFRDAIQSELVRQLEYEQYQYVRSQICEALTANANWELPPKLLKEQESRELTRAVLELRRSGFTDEQILRQLNVIRRSASETTAQALKQHFVFEAIAESEGVVDSNVDYQLEYALIGAQTGETPRHVERRIEREGATDVVRNQIIERKVVDLIQKSAEFEEVPYKSGLVSHDSEEAVDISAGSDDSGIPEVTEEDAKAANREAAANGKL